MRKRTKNAPEKNATDKNVTPKKSAGKRPASKKLAGKESVGKKLAGNKTASGKHPVRAADNSATPRKQPPRPASTAPSQTAYPAPPAAPDGTPANGAADGAVYQLLHRYMKDSSFENPGAPANTDISDPRINIAVQIAATGGGDLYEVTLGYRVDATKDAKILFLADVTYAGLYEIRGATTEQLHRFIYVEAPRQLYPHAAKIIIDAVRDGGLPDLTLEEPDFLEVWHQRRADPAALSLPATTYDSVFRSTPTDRTR